MKKRGKHSLLIADIERPHPTVADKSGDELGAEPLTVRLADSWGDVLGVSDGPAGAEKGTDSRSPGTVPLLDKMKGILQWD
jgi:hypothetical protein